MAEQNFLSSIPTVHPSNNSQHCVGLLATGDTKIKHVSLYSGMAEITRIGKSTLKRGDNRITIEKLPNVMVDESLRIEGHGPCTIHEVSISETPLQKDLDGFPTSAPQKSLVEQRDRLQKALQRVRRCIDATSVYSGSVNARFLSPKDMVVTQEGIEEASAELDEKLIELEAKVESVDKAIEEEKNHCQKENEGKVDSNLRKRVCLNVHAEADCDVELVLIYGVTEATWEATYDIYVKMDTKEKPVSLSYKAAIMQDTGESWEDVSLTLETVTPTFGLNIPELESWTLSVHRPVRFKTTARKSSMAPPGRSAVTEMAREGSSASDMNEYMVDYEEDEGELGGGAQMSRRTLHVTSKGDINATFAVPGLTSIPTDGEIHKVTICQLDLDAVMSWVVVPKHSLKVHLTAKIKNDSDYTFLKGMSSVYVNGSFISRSDVPAVSPQESFDCPLGIDPSIRVTYPPRSKKATRVGSALTFGRARTTNHIFEQRITIHNSKPSSAGSLTVIRVRDQIPTSEDDKIEVKLREPGLSQPDKEKGKQVSVAETVAVKTSEKGCKVVAQWEGTDDHDASDGGDTHLGKDGKVVWVCEDVPAQGRIVLLLSWEVVCPHGTTVVGLDAE